MVADMTSEGDLRGYAGFDAEAAAAAEAEDAELEVAPWFGQGHMAFTVDQGEHSERYQGLVELTGPKLADSLLYYFRQSQQINAGNCDVSGLAEADPELFDVRAVGGAAVLEGNLELRVPFFLEKLRAAAFVDFGQVWRDARSARLSDVVFTPGFGLRYFSAIGPVRIDVGYNPQDAERLTVVTTKVCAAGRLPGTPCTPDTIEDDVEYTSHA